jgi:hypothetical protein
MHRGVRVQDEKAAGRDKLHSPPSSEHRGTGLTHSGPELSDTLPTSLRQAVLAAVLFASVLALLLFAVVSNSSEEHLSETDDALPLDLSRDFTPVEFKEAIQHAFGNTDQDIPENIKCAGRAHSERLLNVIKEEVGDGLQKDIGSHGGEQLGQAEMAEPEAEAESEGERDALKTLTPEAITNNGEFFRIMD